MYLLGYDIGSSSVKASLVNIDTRKSIANAWFPKNEMEITSVKRGWAEQDPEIWWDNLKLATRDLLNKTNANGKDIKAIGISYQMHGLICIDHSHKVLRPSIIWCDSRAVSIGEKVFKTFGEEYCLNHLLNSPGNFTAAKLKWVQENEPELFEKTFKILLPGDYIALKLTGEVNSTISGYSEGIFWDFKNNKPADSLLHHLGFSPDILPDLVPTFSEQGKVTLKASAELGISQGIPVTYRAGDQPNNAFSLNVLNPGEIAATAGTSGVVYGVSDIVSHDPQSRINTFAHVNHTNLQSRLGILLCINGTGILNAWIRKNIGNTGNTYESMNEIASGISIGSDGLVILPFGNGAERILGNRDTGSWLGHISFNTHSYKHILRATQEGIAFAFHYGMQIMKQNGIHPTIIRAGYANMFMSTIFSETLAGITGTTIELFDTDGAQGAAKGAGLGAGIYHSFEETFREFYSIRTIRPDINKLSQYQEAYAIWLESLNHLITLNSN